MYGLCMVKRHTTLNVEDDLIQKAKEKGINISEELENSLKDRLHLIDVQINTTTDKCEFCGKEGERETAKDLQPITNIKNNVKNENLLTWLYPDERWICNTCLRKKTRKCPIV